MNRTPYLVFLVVLASVQCHVPSVVYVSFLINDTSKYNATNDIHIIETADDTPLVEIQLPVLFPLFGEFVDHLFVSPNGFLQTSPVNLCFCCFCPPCAANYFGVVAGILSDLNPFDNELAHVSVQRDNFNTTTIYYNQVNYFGYKDVSLDFGIRLYPDGAINLLYDNITHFDSLHSEFTKCTWLSGLIGPNMSLSDGSFKVTEEQKRVQESEWDAQNIGVYPSSRAGVQSGSHYCLCPISTAWGVVPAVLDNATEVLNITTLSMSCMADAHDLNHSIQIAIVVTTNSSDVILDTDFLAECDPILTSLALKPSPVSFTCDISHINMSYFMEEAVVPITILWKPSKFSLLRTSNSSSSLLDYRPIGSPNEVPPLFVNYSVTSTAGDVSECALNSVVGSCSACEVVYSNSNSSNQNSMTCLALECSFDDTLSTVETYHTTASFSSFSSVISYQTLYMRPSCYNESCEATFVYDFDRNFECCLISDMDCMGHCNGTSVVGKDSRGWQKCCNSDEPPDCLGYCGGSATHDCMGDCIGSSVYDCLGVCNGTAVVDACGICGGGDVSFCARVNISVDTGPNPLLDSNHHLLAEYDASNPHYVSKVPIVVSNTNHVTLNVSFTFPKQHLLPPFVTIPTGVYQINPYSNVSFDIISNISDLFTQQYDNWAVNTIDIMYSRAPSNFLSESYSIDILPLTNNCSNITEMNTCTSLPGCVLCLGLPASGELRILSNSPARRNDEYYLTHAHGGAGLEYDYYYGRNNQNNHNLDQDPQKDTRGDDVAQASGVASSVRALYVSIVPIYHHEILDEDIINNGYCSSGLTTDAACEALSSSSSHPIKRPPSPLKTIYVYIMSAFIYIICSHYTI